MEGTDVLKEVASKTNSEIVQFIIILAVVVIVVAVPMYRLAIRAKRESLEAKEKTLNQYIKREGLLMDVIGKNSSAITELTTMIRNTNTNCNACKDEQTQLMQEVLGEVRETKQLVDKTTAVLIERGHLESPV